VYLSRIQQAQRVIERYQRDLNSKSGQEADKVKRISDLQSRLTRTKNPSTVRSITKELERLNRDIAQLRKDQAGLQKRISDETRKLHDAQNQYNVEQSKEQARLLSSLRRLEEEEARKRDRVVEQIEASLPAAEAAVDASFHAFISHASEDKEDIARPLAEGLQKRGYRIWYDDFQLRVGHSLRRSIDQGLASSRFGIVIFSPNFFAKDWPQYELDGLVNNEVSGAARILPLWHKVSKNEVQRYSPSLADKVALNTANYTLEELVDKLAEVIGKP
jgi:hypothetical protein